MRIKRCFEKGDQLGAVQLMELVVLMRLRLQSVRPFVCAAPPEAVAFTRPPAMLQQRLPGSRAAHQQRCNKAPKSLRRRPHTGTPSSVCSVQTKTCAGRTLANNPLDLIEQA